MLRNKADAWRGSYFEHGLPVVLQTIKYEFGTLASERTQVKLQDDRPSQIKNDVSKTPKTDFLHAFFETTHNIDDQSVKE